MSKGVTTLKKLIFLLIVIAIGVLVVKQLSGEN